MYEIHIRGEHRTTFSVLSRPVLLPHSVLAGGRTGHKLELHPVLQDRAGQDINQDNKKRYVEVRSTKYVSVYQLAYR